MTDNQKKGVIWDMDGVIADTAHAHFLSWQYVFKKQGIDFTYNDFQHIFGQRNDAIINQFLKRDIAETELEAIAGDKEEYFRARASNDVKIFPGVVELLKLLEENSIPSAIASSAPLANINLILRSLGIERYIQAVASGREVTESKPSPQIFQLAARKIGAEASNCIVIEDAVAGVRGAKRGGMHCVAVTNTHPAESLSEADLVVDSLTSIGILQINQLLS